MKKSINIDNLMNSNNNLITAISHIETSKELIDSGISNLDYSLLNDLPISEINRLAEEYINYVKYVQYRLDAIVKANTECVYAPPDIMNENKYEFK